MNGAAIGRPASATSAVASKVKGQGRKVTWCVWQVLADKSRTKRPRNTNIGRKVVHPMGNNTHSFKVIGKGQGHQADIMLRPEVRHIFRTERLTNFKLGVQMEDEDRYRRDGQSPAGSKVKVAMSRGASDRCWPISLVRKVPEASKLVSRLWMPRTIMRTSFKVKRSKVVVCTNTDAFIYDEGCQGC